MAESALIVSVPEAEPFVSATRYRFDPSAKIGVPAHVTLLYPFVAPDQLTEQVSSAIRAAVASEASFTFRLSSFGRFPDTLYLAPEPAHPFIALTETLGRLFPDLLPYGGQHRTIVPHLTVARGSEVDLVSIQARLTAALARSEGIRACCKGVDLIENSSGRWHRMLAFALGPSVASVG